MTNSTTDSFIVAVIASIITGAVWQPIHDLNPIGNVILVLFDVASWAAFFISLAK